MHLKCISPTEEPDGDQENPQNVVMGILPAGIAAGKAIEIAFVTLFEDVLPV